MFSINQFLEKYRKRLFGEEEKRIAVLSAIKDGSGILLNEKEITLKNGMIFLSTDPIVKNEIFLHKEHILTLCKERNLPFMDIR